MKIQARQIPVKDLIEWLSQQIGQVGKKKSVCLNMATRSQNHNGIWLNMVTRSQSHPGAMRMILLHG